MTRGRFLITTALEETWLDDVPVLFLGEWCRRHSRRERWSRLDAEVLPYHWDDRAKLHADYLALRELHERLLGELGPQLNELHGVDRGPRYWRILIGEWLGWFTQILFDRWTCVQEAARREPSGTIVLTGGEESLIPGSMADFARLMTEDTWNHRLYADILRDFTAMPCSPRPGGIAAAAPTPVPWRRRLQGGMDAWYALTNSSAHDGDAFLLGTYLPAGDEKRLVRRLGQPPRRWRPPLPPRAAADPARRRWIAAGESRSPFEACLRALIPRQLPTTYLEGYGRLVARAESLPWPKRPRLVWTSSAWSADDVFKAWSADKAERGAPLVIGQHGGHYGTGRWSFTEDYELSIGDAYLSWGWSEPKQPRVRPVGQLKSRSPLGVLHADQPGALLVLGAMPRYSYYLYSAVVASQCLRYFEDQYAFVASLPERVRASLTVRLYPQDYGWDQAARWRERFPALRLDEGRSDIRALIRRSRLYVSTYNATTYLESLSMDVPTVIYWDPRYWELRDSALPYFEELKAAGIFHETPESAARHVAAVWDDVDAWWGSPDVRQAAERFKSRYCLSPKDLVGRVGEALRDVMATAERRRNEELI